MGKIEEGEDTAAPPSQAAAALLRTQAAEREREARGIFIYGGFEGDAFALRFLAVCLHGVAFYTNTAVIHHQQS
jgi:hypothetical protein